MSTDLKRALRQWIVASPMDGRPPAGFDDETDSIADGIMDSLALVRTLACLEHEQGLAIAEGDTVPERYASVRASAELAESRRADPQRPADL